MDLKEPEIVGDDDGIFVIVDGVKVAKRERGTWIALKPEWTVRDHEGLFVGEDIGSWPNRNRVQGRASSMMPCPE